MIQELANSKNLDTTVHGLENDCSIALEWFADNFMKLNADKCHLLVLGNRCDDPVTVRIGSTDVANSSEEKLLGVRGTSKGGVVGVTTPALFGKKDNSALFSPGQSIRL